MPAGYGCEFADARTLTRGSMVLPPDDDYSYDALPELLNLIRIRPSTLERTVFKYLKHDGAPNELSKVPHKTLIACTSRSGSTMLQSWLQRYGLDAQEFFNTEVAVKTAAALNRAKTLSEYAN